MLIVGSLHCEDHVSLRSSEVRGVGRTNCCASSTAAEALATSATEHTVDSFILVLSINGDS